MVRREAFGHHHPYLSAGVCALMIHGLVLALGPGIRGPRFPKEKTARAVAVTLAKRPAPVREKSFRVEKKKQAPATTVAKPVTPETPVPVKAEPVMKPVNKEVQNPVPRQEPTETPAEPESTAETPTEEKAPAETSAPSRPAETAMREGPAPTDAAGDREAAPLYRLNRPPRYPRLARKRGWEGLVLLDVEVLKDGRVAAVAISETSGYAVLDDAAAKAVRGWRFEPGIRLGRPVTMRVKVPVRFRLRDSEE